MQKQPETCVTDYYTKFKSLVDESSELQTLPECSCGAVKVLSQREEEEQVHLFHGGFNSEQYSHIKATILNTYPLSSLRRVLIKCEEKNLVLQQIRKEIPSKLGITKNSKREPTKSEGKQVANFALAAERKEYPEAVTSGHTLHGVRAKNHENAHENMTEFEVPDLREIPHNDQTSGHIESLSIKEAEYTSQTESEPIEKKRVSIDDMNEEVTNDSKKESSSESEREILSEEDPQNIRRTRRP
ncbi:hypothetical protein KIW84_074169 [Lathyrus oleraceus]|uniref:Retrotransposon gag domain-containing protein n=1 Tax=Pisum sativum TaxID=3888 RepID=A0A9D4ZXM8_PEA|nr:hypothetical protein KIW84_074169 [Pisum sativum]